MKFRDVCTRQCTLGTIGFLLAAISFFAGAFWSQIVLYGIGKEMALTPTSKTHDGWKEPPLQLSLDIYFFNWTNPEDFKNLSTKPILQELGPYRFTEKPEKVDINWHPHNHTVSYRRKSDFYFDGEGSNGTLSDKITTLNVIALSAAAKAKGWNYFRRLGVNTGLKVYEQEIAVVKTADELLFTGYSDDMIDIARQMPQFLGDDMEVPFDRFGWFYTRNGSADLTGHFNMFTGTDEFQNIGKMHTWNYKENSGFFDSHCGMINGSAGEFYPPNLKEGGTVEMFSPDMCRTIPLEYTETVERNHLTGYKFSGGPKSVDNGTLYPENRCFCGGECLPSGVMNISSCRFGTPVFMSYPHFYSADPYYVDQVEGVSPSQEKHEFYMILEPNTAAALEVAARFQVNILVEPVPDIALYEGVPRIILPLIWFEQKVILPSEITDELQIIPKVLAIGQIVAGVLFAIGLIMACWYPAQRLIRRRRGDFKPTQKTAEISSKSKKDLEAAASCEKTATGPEISPLLNTALCASPVKQVPTIVNSSSKKGSPSVEEKKL